MPALAKGSANAADADIRVVVFAAPLVPLVVQRMHTLAVLQLDLLGRTHPREYLSQSLPRPQTRLR